MMISGAETGAIISYKDIPFSSITTINPTQWSLKCYMFFLSSISGCETAGMISLKHIYEIAQVKKQDEAFEFHTLEQVCKKIIASCHTLGVKVVKEIDPKEYQTFLEERRKIEREEEERQEEIRIAKILRLKK